MLAIESESMAGKDCATCKYMDELSEIGNQQLKALGSKTIEQCPARAMSECHA